ncbi:MAG: hypothetical protein M3Q07_10090, partial [Pseudobdellovibrionaceae bacterium]|nr:hypothetical protein [Pseudobdellovibrionaceae bacterium]
MRFGWLILVHCLVLLLARPAQAQQEMKVYTLAEQENGSELAPFIYSYEDKFSKRTLSQLTQPQFKRFKLNKKRSITFSYSSSAFWLRFAVANPSEVDRNIAIK